MRSRPTRRMVAARATRSDLPATMAVTRIHRSNEIRAVFAARNVAHGRLVSVHGRGTGGSAETRAAVVGGRDVGNAVRRNRAKRRLRAALAIVGLPGGLDLVVRAKPGAVDADFSALRNELTRLVSRVARRADGVQDACAPAAEAR